MGSDPLSWPGASEDPGPDDFKLPDPLDDMCGPRRDCYDPCGFHSEAPHWMCYVFCTQGAPPEAPPDELEKECKMECKSACEWNSTVPAMHAGCMKHCMR